MGQTADVTSDSTNQPEPVDASAVADGGLNKANTNLDQQKLFDQFVETLTSTAMIGTFTIDGMDPGKLREERYEIKRVVKADEGDFWNIFARMKFGDIDVTLPFPVEVKWAGDTPVITVDKLKLIGMGAAFDARIVISDGKYAGTWNHGKVGGLMFGRIEKVEKKTAVQDEKEDTTKSE